MCRFRATLFRTIRSAQLGMDSFSPESQPSGDEAHGIRVLTDCLDNSLRDVLALVNKIQMDVSVQEKNGLQHVSDSDKIHP